MKIKLNEKKGNMQTKSYMNSEKSIMKGSLLKKKCKNNSIE